MLVESYLSNAKDVPVDVCTVYLCKNLKIRQFRIPCHTEYENGCVFRIYVFESGTGPIQFSISFASFIRLLKKKKAGFRVSKYECCAPTAEKD